MATQALFDIGNVILEPTSTFARLKDKTRAWLPLFILIALSVGIMVWWISTLDFPWLVEHTVAAQPKATPEMRAAMEKFMTPTSMMWSSVIGAVLGTLVAMAVSALYYLVAGKIMGVPIGFGKWFGFSVWTSVPRLLTVPLSALQIMTSNGRLAPEDLNMASLNFLLFHLPVTHPWASLVGSMDLTMFWSIALAVLGLKAWTGRSTGTCVLVAVLPYLIIYGLWAAKIAFLG
ncbi:YIP1 family protein [Massilia norwichensis]|uniref:YIP1 family protein n=1 Tax=Massilia norwichensis TaxID=1442366 RepID=A0ABT2A1U6_9BURK|nr:YIP1 family protein [Massilia norwichensis]MCS0588139.1 YIP1 family protein [Massilia norwichensis]